MLEGLNAVDWCSLDHAYGSASDIPDFLRQLETGDEVARDSALGGLMSRILHQGTHYSATAPAMAFLIELLREPAVQGKQELLNFLACAADVEDPMGEELFANLKLHPAEANAMPLSYWDRPEDEYLQDVANTFDAVRAGLPVFLAFLGHADRGLRLAAAQLVRVVASTSQELAAQLFYRITQEPDPVVRVVLLFALRDARDASLLPYLVDELLLDPQVPVCVRWAAAVGVASWAEEHCHPDATGLLSGALLDPELRWKGLAVPLGELDRYGGAHGVEVQLIIRESCRALERVDRKVSLPVFLSAASALPEAAYWCLMGSMHRRFFGGATVSADPADWLEDQLEVLRCLAHTDRLHRYTSFPEYLARWGLPRRQVELQWLLAWLEGGALPGP